uniref:AB hydrolase-1 domain-containing protein n=1 Tax=Pinguiococcus pyrenoidosus TaxID=172671 RepID=A0A7R9U128_9STRA|mmetsp:Transcript_10894/g.40774  ORF Transcript_10894/g.40774 Transcript_10894/m.40774 type:complete len:344 (+) Transcript_10894:166-1197(+)
MKCSLKGGLLLLTVASFCSRGHALALQRLPFPVPAAVKGSITVDGNNCVYAAMGKEDAPLIFLVHGFGASKYHWRYQMPYLAEQGFRVVAPDLLGFGESDKPITQYTPELWVRQCAALMEEQNALAKKKDRKAMVAGNSLGGYVALALASERKDLIASATLLNGAGKFANGMREDDPPKPGPSPIDNMMQIVSDALQRMALTTTFFYTKQPARIEQVLRQVYIDSTNVDADLIESIRRPSDDEKAAEVFYRIVSRTATGAITFKDTIDGRLAKLDPSFPLYLLWGQQDPWIRPITADKIQSIRPETRRVNLPAGHCPHDEVPTAVNEALVQFMAEIGLSPTAA